MVPSGEDSEKGQRENKFDVGPQRLPVQLHLVALPGHFPAQFSHRFHFSSKGVYQDFGPKPFVTLTKVDILLCEGTEVRVYCHRSAFSSALLAALGRVASLHPKHSRDTNA